MTTNPDKVREAKQWFRQFNPDTTTDARCGQALADRVEELEAIISAKLLNKIHALEAENAKLRAALQAVREVVETWPVGHVDWANNFERVYHQYVLPLTEGNNE